MSVGIVAILKDENQYLEEWILHHKSIGFTKFYLGDNYSIIPVQQTINELKIEDVEVIYWPNQEIGGQMRFYEYIASKCDEIFLAAIDIDEFIILKNHATIQEFLDSTIEKYSYFSSLSMSWRLYGSRDPKLTRIPALDYKEYHENGHIKEIFRAEDLINFPDPHHGKYVNKSINELGEEINSPIGIHTSKDIYIHHNWSRSLEEYKEKMTRGRGDKMKHSYDLNEFFEYNKRCTLHD